MTGRRTPPSPGGALYLLPGGRAEQDSSNRATAAAPPGFPAWLPDLSGENPTRHPAREHWDRLVPHLPPGVLTDTTAPTFALLCVALATYAEADQIIQAAGMLIPGDGGFLVENPALKIRDRADAQVAKWAKAFGLSPDGRPRIAPPADTPGGPPQRALPHLFE